MSVLGPCCLKQVSSKDGSLWFHNICNFSGPTSVDDRDDYNEDIREEGEEVDSSDNNNNNTTTVIVNSSQQESNNEKVVETETDQNRDNNNYSVINVGTIKDKTSNNNEIISLTTQNNSDNNEDNINKNKNVKKKKQKQKDIKKDNDKNDHNNDNNNEESSSNNNNNPTPISTSTYNNNDNDDNSITGYSVMSDCSLKSLHSTLNKYTISDNNEYDDNNNKSTLFEHRKNKTTRYVLFSYITNTYAYRTAFTYKISFLNDDENDDSDHYEYNIGNNKNKHNKYNISKDEKKKKLIEIKDHKEALALTASCMGRNHKLVADKLNVIGECYYNMKEYDLALKSYLEGLNIYSVKVGDDQPECIITRMNIGKMQLLRNELEDCLEAYSHALYMKNALGCNDVYVGEIHEVLSYVHYRRCENSEALKDLKRALRTYRDLFGDDDTKVIHTVVSIGTLYVASGDLKKAMTIYREAIKLKIGLVGKLHEEVADILIKWGLCCIKLYDTKMAMKILKRAYSMYVERLGETSIKTIVALSHIGNIYLLDGQEEKSLKAHSRAIRICKKVDLGSSYVMANALVNLGILWMVKNNNTNNNNDSTNNTSSSTYLDKTVRCFNEALLIYKNYYNCSDHPSVSDTLYHLGTIHETTGNYNKALKYYNRVLQMRIKYLGGNSNNSSGGGDTNITTERHTDIARTLRKIATIQCEYTNDLTTALNNYGRILDIYSQTIGQTILFADVLIEASDILDLLGEHAKSKSGFKEAVRIYKLNKLDMDHPSVTYAMERIKTLRRVSNTMIGGNATTNCKIINAQNVYDECNNKSTRYNVISDDDDNNNDVDQQLQLQNKINDESMERIQHHFGK